LEAFSQENDFISIGQKSERTETLPRFLFMFFMMSRSKTLGSNSIQTFSLKHWSRFLVDFCNKMPILKRLHVLVHRAVGCQGGLALRGPLWLWWRLRARGTGCCDLCERVGIAAPVAGTGELVAVRCMAKRVQWD
jgi:hypothetical protein